MRTFTVRTPAGLLRGRYWQQPDWVGASQTARGTATPTSLSPVHGAEFWDRSLTPNSGRTAPAAPLLVDDLHAKRLLVFVFVVIDVNQNLLLPGRLTGRKPQADGVGLASPDLARSVAVLAPALPTPAPLPATSTQAYTHSPGLQAPEHALMI